MRAPLPRAFVSPEAGMPGPAPVPTPSEAALLTSDKVLAGRQERVAAFGPPPPTIIVPGLPDVWTCKYARFVLFTDCTSFVFTKTNGNLVVIALRALDFKLVLAMK